MPSSRNQRTPVRAVLAWLGVAVVALGWMQSLVVCTQPCCDGHVKLARGCERAAHAAAVAATADEATAAAPACACCRRGAERAAGDRREERSPLRASSSCCDGCVHVGLGVELGMPPDLAAADVALPPRFVVAVAPFAVVRTIARPVVHPPATGPPRRDAPTALRASTLLVS
jgi:hypothetical protein